MRRLPPHSSLHTLSRHLGFRPLPRHVVGDPLSAIDLGDGRQLHVGVPSVLPAAAVTWAVSQPVAWMMLLALAMLGMAVAVFFVRTSRGDVGTPPIAPAKPAELPSETTAQLRLVGNGNLWQLLADDFPLMHLEPVAEGDLPAARQPLTGVWAQFFSRALETSIVVDLVACHRFVLVRVPAAMRGSGRWMQQANGVVKAVVIDAPTGRITAIPEVVASAIAGGAFVGSALALAPVLIAATLAALAQMRMQSAVRLVQRGVDDLKRRGDLTDDAVLAAGRAMLAELDQWSGAPSGLWSQRLAHQQVLVENTARVCRARVEDLLAGTIRERGTATFVGFEPRQRQELDLLVSRYTEAAVVCAQMRTIEAAIRVAPEHLAQVAVQLERITDGLTRELHAFAARLDEQAAAPLPGAFRVRKRARAGQGRTLLADLSERVRRVARLAEPSDVPLVLSPGPDGRIVVEVPAIDPAEMPAAAG